MVVDMQEEFLSGRENTAYWNNVERLKSNICDTIRDTVSWGGKIFLVEYAWFSQSDSQILKALPSNYIKIMKKKPFFSILEDVRKWEGLWVWFDAFDDVSSVSFSWVYTSYCIRDCYEQVDSLNTCQASSSLSWVRNKYISKLKKNPVFLWEEESKDFLEDYL